MRKETTKRTNIVFSKKCPHCNLWNYGESGMCVCPHLSRPYTPSYLVKLGPCEHFVWRNGTTRVWKLKSYSESGEITIIELD